ncbi:MAG: DoxX family membrane protein [Ignavibacteria bacterium]|nr:DoxX family membrane protein [Ignavibacteria bacterium]
MERLSQFARLLLGGVFLVTGLLKIPDIQDFASFIAGAAELPSDTAYLLATTVIVLEVGSGVGLVVGWRVEIWSSVAVLLLLGFIAAPAVFAGSWTARQCHCFGWLFPDMPPTLHLVLNLLLLNSGVTVLIVVLSGGRSPTRRAILIAICAASTAYGFLHEYMVPDDAKSTLHNDQVIRVREFLERKTDGLRSASQEGMIALILNGENFGCPVCVEDLHAMCDSLNEIVARYPRARVVALLQGGRGKSVGRLGRMAEAWARSNHIAFPVVGDSEGISGRVGITGTSIVLMNRYNNVLALEEFPLGAEKRSGILRLFVQMQDARRESD